MRLVLDTNIYCDYAEGLPDVVDAIAMMGDSIFLPSIVIGELSFGFIKGTKQAYNENKLQQIIEHLRIKIIEENPTIRK